MIRTIIGCGSLDAAVRRLRLRPDYTLPLRLQTSGQSALSRDSLEIKRVLWARALSDGWIWRRACVAGLLVGTIEIVLDPGAEHASAWGIAARLAMLAAFAVGAGVILAASHRVREAMVKRELSRN